MAAVCARAQGTLSLSTILAGVVIFGRPAVVGLSATYQPLPTFFRVSCVVWLHPICFCIHTLAADGCGTGMLVCSLRGRQQPGAQAVGSTVLHNPAAGHALGALGGRPLRGVVPVR